MAKEYFLRVIVDFRNQPVAVSLDVEHRKPAHGIR
jgi:hypothetical protein